MSNAMRMGKRSLAGVAAGALALGMLSIAGAGSATAAKTIKPKVTPSASAASVGPVRFSTTTVSGTATQDAVLSSPMLLLAVGTDDTRVTNDDTIILDINTAPSSNAKLYLNKTPLSSASAVTSWDDSVSTASGDDTTQRDRLSDATWFSVQGDGTIDDTIVATTVAVTEGGVYGGNILIYDNDVAWGNATALIQTTPFSFTTAGKPAAMTLTPDTLSLTASTATASRGASVVSFADSAGSLTQIGTGNGDQVVLSSSASSVAGVAPVAGSVATTVTLTSADFDDTTATVLGTGAFQVQPTATAGTATVTAAPQGTLPSSGVASKTVAVTTTAGGSTAPTALALSSPTTQVIDDTILDDTLGYDVNRQLVTSLVVTGTGATPSASQTVTFTGSAAVTGLTIAGTSVSGTSATVLVTAGADGTVNIPVSWTAGGASDGDKLTFSTGTGAATKWVVVDIIDPTADNSTSPQGTIVQKVGEATSFDVTLVDDFGNASIGYVVTGKTTTGASSAAGVTNTSGQTTISVPAPSATFSGASQITFTVLTGAGGSSGLTLTPVNITYTASGNITSLSVQPSGTASAFTAAGATITSDLIIAVPSAQNGLVGTTASTAFYTRPTSTTPASSTLTGITSLATFAVTTSPLDSAVVTVPEGVKVSATAPTSATLFSGGSQTATIAASGTAYVWSTKIGEHDITVTAGGLTATGKLRVVTTSSNAYNIALSPTSQTMLTGQFKTLDLTVTDPYGNIVDTDDSGTVAMSITGQVLFGGFQNSIAAAATGTDGKYVATLIAGNDAGSAVVTAVPTASNLAYAWVTGYTRPAGFPAPITSATATITVESSSSKSISITGTRTKVSGKPGIRIDGVTTGLENGETVIPYFRFPGQTAYTQGSARPVITDDEFTWQRKTGKKFYAYVTNDDGAIRSNRVIIQAK